MVKFDTSKFFLKTKVQPFKLRYLRNEKVKLRLNFKNEKFISTEKVAYFGFSIMNSRASFNLSTSRGRGKTSAESLVIG